MSAILTAIRSDIRHRRLQTFVILVVMLPTSGAATLAGSLLVETDAPYRHAFAAANGAHLTLVYAARAVPAARVRATAHARGVKATAGPWPEVLSIYTQSSADQIQAQGLTIVGRSRPDTSVDRLTMESGRWARASGEVVVSQHLADGWALAPGSEIIPGQGVRGPTLHVVGIAASISPYTDAWVTPAQISGMVSKTSPLQEQMLYRLAQPNTDVQLQAAVQRITAHLPHGSVTSVGSYLQVERDADLTTSVMVPFLLAFSAFALAASVLIIANIVSGVVIAGFRDIGVMKSIGFTPGGVMAVLLGQILAPAAIGSAIGVVLGTLASQPFLTDTAHALGLPAPFTAVLPVDAGVLVLMLGVVMLATFVPARHAAGMSAVTAMTRGLAPAGNRVSRLGSALAGLPLPRALSLGLGDSFARPARSLMTVGAIVTGVATVIFAINLHLSLAQVQQHLDRGRYVQVIFFLPPPGSQGPQKQGFAGSFPTPPSASRVIHTLQRTPGAAHFVAEGTENVTLSNVSEPIPYYAYRGASDWTGFALISGRWFAHPGEVVAPTRLLKAAHLHVGSATTAYVRGRAVHLRIVGEIFDQTDSDLLLRGPWSTLKAADPRLAVTQFEVQVKPGTDPRSYAQHIRLPGLGADIRENDSDSTFILFNTVIGGLALVLTLIAVAGVFNTVILNTQERRREIAILKAVGMAPVQVVAMVVSSVCVLGVVAGIIGIPAGMYLHSSVLQTMGGVASGTAIPPAFFDLISPALFPLLVLVGVVIAALGAWLPAQWAASSKVAEVLQAE